MKNIRKIRQQLIQCYKQDSKLRDFRLQIPFSVELQLERFLQQYATELAFVQRKIENFKALSSVNENKNENDNEDERKFDRNNQPQKPNFRNDNMNMMNNISGIGSGMGSRSSSSSSTGIGSLPSIVNVTNERMNFKSTPVVYCICGSQYVHIKDPKVDETYWCDSDVCGNRELTANDARYHCPKVKHRLHPDGYDVCEKCYQKQEETIRNKKQRNNNYSLSDKEIYLLLFDAFIEYIYASNNTNRENKSRINQLACFCNIFDYFVEFLQSSVKNSPFTNAVNTESQQRNRLVCCPQYTSLWEMLFELKYNPGNNVGPASPKQDVLNKSTYENETLIVYGVWIRNWSRKKFDQFQKDGVRNKGNPNYDFGERQAYCKQHEKTYQDFVETKILHKWFGIIEEILDIEEKQNNNNGNNGNGINEMNQVNQMNQINQMNQMNQMNQNQMNAMNNMNRVNMNNMNNMNNVNENMNRMNQYPYGHNNMGNMGNMGNVGNISNTNDDMSQNLVFGAPPPNAHGQQMRQTSMQQVPNTQFPYAQTRAPVQRF